jgi:colanic acid/amylovoran biosynthesis protein
MTIGVSSTRDPFEEDPVRIFLDPSGYAGRNLGDAAMLEVAIARLRTLWPRAALTVHAFDTGSPANLDPRIELLDPWGAHCWCADTVLVGNARRIRSRVAWCLDCCRLLRRRAPRLMRRVAEAALAWKRRPLRLVGDYIDAIGRADLVLVTGAGSLNDAFKRHAFVLLETIELALEAKRVTALVGQGIGPISDPVLRKRAAAILPRVDFIALRDGVASLALLESIGVPATRISVTGDDAIVLAYRARKSASGTAIGVNVRATGYSGIGSDVVAGIGRVVREAARRHAASLVAVPISRYAEDDDLRTIGRMLADRSVAEGAGPSTPAQLLEILPQCRIVVAGSYHAAVLALSMGIPAVTIAGSDYYAHKFLGLAGQFGPACRVELTSRPDFYARLGTAIDEAWQAAEASRDHLLGAAEQQIRLGDAAYRDVFELVEKRRRRAGS